jgi:hypothetical protein
MHFAGKSCIVIPQDPIRSPKNGTGIPPIHKTEDEKGMEVVLEVLVVPEDRYDAWLNAQLETSMDFMRAYPAEHLLSEVAPSTPSAKAQSGAELW